MLTFEELAFPSGATLKPYSRVSLVSNSFPEAVRKVSRRHRGHSRRQPSPSVSLEAARAHARPSEVDSWSRPGSRSACRRSVPSVARGTLRLLGSAVKSRVLPRTRTGSNLHKPKLMPTVAVGLMMHRPGNRTVTGATRADEHWPRASEAGAWPGGRPRRSGRSRPRSGTGCQRRGLPRPGDRC
jgi:hypothetical protein